MTYRADHPALTSTGLKALLDAVSRGDREAGATLIQQYGPLVRQRFRRRLGPGLRRLMDSTDLVSTVGRRLDTAISEGRVSFDSEPQLLGFLHALAVGAVADKARVLARLRRAEGSDSPWAQAMADRIEQGTAAVDPFDSTVDHALEALESETDRKVLGFWLHGMSLTEIAFEMEAQPNAVRQRWFRIRERLALEFGAKHAA